jgi:uncharacterized OsmC-like protein
MSHLEAGAQSGAEVVYRAEVHVEAAPGMIKLVSLPAESDPVAMGVHGEIAKHFKLAEDAFTPRASTLDYIVGATAGCLTGVLSRGLTARKIAIGDGRLKVDAIGEIESDEGVLVVRRIHVVAHLKAEESQREAAKRVAASCESQCPVYRSIHKAIDITTELDFQPIDK